MRQPPTGTAPPQGRCLMQNRREKITLHSPKPPYDRIGDTSGHRHCGHKGKNKLRRKGQAMNEMLGVSIPEPMQFLNWGWWIIHVVGITVVFLIGRAVGKKCQCGKSSA
jgi:hypothetical protein